MQHPDEGTIHAWLDGALDEAAAARVAEHVATCPECESRVVEARGLIAGASRVLSALDAVPAGVIPPGPADAPDEKAAEPRRSTRHWWRRRGVTPALAAAAAVAFVAVGSSLVLRERAPMDERAAVLAPLPPREAPVARDTAVVAAKAAAAPAASASDSSAAPAPRAGLAARPEVVPTVAAPHRETEIRGRAETNAAPSASGMAGAPAPAAPPVSAQAPSRDAAADLAARKPARPSADSAERFKRMRSMPMQLSQVVVTSVGASREDANAPERALRGAEPRSTAAAAPAIAPPAGLAPSLAGCYEIVDGETGFVPRRFVLDTSAATTIMADSAGARGYEPLAEVRKLRGVDGEPVVTGWWRAVGPIARVEWERAGSRAVLELRPGAGARFATSLTVDGTSRPVTLRRCTE